MYVYGSDKFSDWGCSSTIMNLLLMGGNRVWGSLSGIVLGR